MSQRRWTIEAVTAGEVMERERAARWVARAKRVADIGLSVLALLLTAPLWPVLALAIRWDSPGPALFRQMRVGRSLADRTELFVMFKFRSMRVDAERGTGAVWARKGDTRVTRIGRLLRRSRLDELPQLVNVLRGEMSLIGPRPERPGIMAGLAREVPGFVHRTRLVRPGITGLAQVNQGYDTCVDDVRRKLGFDQAYAACMDGVGRWLLADAAIAVRTLMVMAQGRGC